MEEKKEELEDDEFEDSCDCSHCAHHCGCEDDEFKKQYFFLRGRSYILNKNTTLGINDIKTSCKMGEKLACETLNDIDKIIKTN